MVSTVRILYNERCIICGRTGSGKTYLARHICASLRRLVVCDPKGTLNTPDWNLQDWSSAGVRELRRGKPARLRIPAPIDENWEDYFYTLWSIGNVTVYIDEVYGVVDPGHKAGKWLTALYTRGRELGIGVWAATQRPSLVPLFTMSEADWFFVFRLNMEEDRKRVASMSTPQLEQVITDRYGFWTYNPVMDRAIYTPRYQPIPVREKVNVA